MQLDSTYISKYNKIFFFVGVCLLCVILYGKTVTFDYALDDIVVIKENSFTKIGVQGIPAILLNNSFEGYFHEKSNIHPGGRYRPLSLILFSFEVELFGLNPHVSHAINIGLYIILIIILFFFFQQILSKYSQYSNTFIKRNNFIVSAFACVLFCIHPVHTEVVANIKGRDEILSLLFSILTIYQSFKTIKKPSIFSVLLLCLYFILAIFSKENAVVLLILVPLSIYFFSSGAPLEKSIRFVLTPLIIVFSGYLIFRFSVIGVGFARQNLSLMNNPYVFASFEQKYSTIIAVLGHYFKLLFVPYPLTCDYYPYHIQLKSWHSIEFLLSLIIHSSLIFFVLKYSIKYKIASWSILFYLTGITLVSNIFFNIGTFMSERFLFFPSVPFCFLISVLLFYFFRKYFQNRTTSLTKLRQIFYGIITLFIVSLAYLSYQRVKYWKDDFTLFSKDAITSSESAYSNKSLGNIFIEKALVQSDSHLRKGHLHKAIFHLSKAVSIYPEYIEALFLLGNAHFLYNNNLSRTLEYYSKVLLLNPNFEQIYVNLPLIFQESGNSELKLDFLTKQLKIHPKAAEFHFFMGKELIKAGKLEKSVQFLKKAIIFAPEKIHSYIELGRVYSILGKYNLSIDIHQQALNIEPDNSIVLKNLSILYAQTGDSIRFKEVKHFLRDAESSRK